MARWWKKKKNKKVMGKMLKSMLRPVIFPLVGIIDATLVGWKAVVVAKLKTVDPDEFIDVFCANVDALRSNLKRQIERSLED